MAEVKLESNMVFIEISAEPYQYETNTANETNDVKTLSEEANNNSSTSSSDTCLTVHRNPLRCTECRRFNTDSEEKLLRHIRKVHRGENPFQCNMCDFTTYNNVLYEEHIRRHQGIKPYKCSHCPYRSISKQYTKKHEQIHRPDNPRKCDKCGFIAKHIRSLKHHMSTHSQVPAKECATCKVRFHTQQSYLNHRKSRRRCPECRILVCSKLVSQHRLQEHGVVKGKTVKKKSIFTCAVCRWEGNTKSKVLLHLIHHPNQEVNEGVVDTTILKDTGVVNDIIEISD